MSIKRFAWVCILLPSLLAAAPAGSQEPGSVSEREEVTAIDLVVELAKGDALLAELPEGLGPDDFKIRRNGRTLEVIGVESPGVAEPWHLLIYLDYSLSSTASIRWAASELADRASSLVELGQVEIVAADPEPRLLLAPTRDADLVNQTLSGVFLEAEADNVLVAQREEYLLQRDEAPELSSAEGLRRLIEEEQRLIGEHRDGVLHYLVEKLPATARRALLLVSDGYDSRPGEFYAEYASIEDLPPVSPISPSESWAEVVAAYGWSVIAVVSPESETAKRHGLVPAKSERTLGFLLPGITGRLDGSLNPQRAAALHELGQELAEQNRLEDAEASLTEALSFYRNHPKYELQRAAVLADLGRVLLGLDRVADARVVLRHSVELDPTKESEFPFVAARLLDPLEAADDLAASSAGWLAIDGETLSAALAALYYRFRLTFQFRGAPDGTVHRIGTVVSDPKLVVRAPSRIRFGTPAAVSELRARRLLRGDLEQGDFEVKARFVESAADYRSRRGVVKVSVRDAEAADRGEHQVRLTLGLATEEGLLETRQETVVLDGDAYDWTVEVGREHVWLALVVEEIETSRWGAATADL